MAPKLTVITPTMRPGGIDIWKASLQRQTFTDFEALLVDERYAQRHLLVDEYMAEDDRLRHLEPPPKRDGTFWNLSQSLNFALAHAQGELVVFYQDYIWLPEDALARFWQRYQEAGDVLISGVGHKGQRPGWAINLGGHLTIFCRSGDPRIVADPLDTPDDALRAPEGCWFRDPRFKGRGFHPATPIEWEGNWAAVSKRVCEVIGGFDEAFDLGGFGYDNVNFAERAQLAGYGIWLDEENACIGYAHEFLFPEWSGDPKHKSDVRVNERLWRERIDAMQAGTRSWRVEDLDRMKAQIGLHA